MIISHRHRFIFIKTYKTASSSVEVALADLLGDGNVITPAQPELDRQRTKAVGGQNYRLDHPEVPKIPLWRKVLRRPERYYHTTVGYYDHMQAWRVRRYIGDEIWRSYFKFTFERNPWDRQVSWYRYKTRNKTADAKPSFAQFNANRRKVFVKNWDLYTSEGKIALDFVGRFENLAEDFDQALERLGLAGEVSLSQVSPSVGGSVNYRSYYDDSGRAMIGTWCRPEIDHFGYTF